MQRWKFSNGVKNNPNKNILKIWLCNVPGIETIIKIFQIGWIPTGFSRRGLCTGLRIHILIQTLALSTHRYTGCFLFSLTQHRGLGGISWVEYFRGAVLFWSPAVRWLQSFYFKENSLQFFSLISHLFSFPPTFYLRGSVKFFHQYHPYLYGWKKTDDCTDWNTSST